MSNARTKRLNESDKPVINFGIADDFHKLIIPQNTTANLAQITPSEPGSIAFDTTLNQLVVNDGTGFSPAGGTGSVTQVNTSTGLTGGPITTTGTIALADTAVTPGSYTSANITVDAQGRLTAAADGGGGGGSTFLDGSFEIQNTADTTKIIEFDASNVPSGTPSVITVGPDNVNLTLAASVGSFAAQNLFNLYHVAIPNVAVSPAIDATGSLGDVTHRWEGVYANEFTAGTGGSLQFAAVPSGGALLVDGSGFTAVQTGTTHTLGATDGSVLVDFTAPNNLILGKVTASGAYKRKVRSTTTDTTLDAITDNVLFCDTTTSNINVTLPTGEDGLEYWIRNTVDGGSGNSVTAVPAGGQNIGPRLSATIFARDSLHFVFDASTSTWWQI